VPPFSLAWPNFTLGSPHLQDYYNSGYYFINA
jgi:hypothetical protein